MKKFCVLTLMVLLSSMAFSQGADYEFKKNTRTGYWDMVTKITGLTSLSVTGSITVGDNLNVTDTTKTNHIKDNGSSLIILWSNVLGKRHVSIDSTLFVNWIKSYGTGKIVFQDDVEMDSMLTVEDITINKKAIMDTVIINGDTLTGSVDMTDISGNIANSGVPLDTVFSDVYKVGADDDSLYIYSDGNYAYMQCTDLLNPDVSMVGVARGNAVMSVVGAGVSCLAADVSTTISGTIITPKNNIHNLDQTPDVTGYNVYSYTSSPSVSNDTILDLDNALVDAEYTIIGSSDTYKVVIEDSSIFKMAGNVTFDLGLHDVIRFRCVSVGPNLFIEISRSNN